MLCVANLLLPRWARGVLHPQLAPRARYSNAHHVRIRTLGRIDTFKSAAHFRSGPLHLYANIPRRYRNIAVVAHVVSSLHVLHTIIAGFHPNMCPYVCYITTHHRQCCLLFHMERFSLRNAASLILGVPPTLWHSASKLLILSVACALPS